jgi:tryptophan-rich sensory protein
MTSLLFLLMAIAMVLAWRGNRRAGVVVFALAALLSVAWFNYHVTDPLDLDF